MNQQAISYKPEKTTLLLILCLGFSLMFCFKYFFYVKDIPALYYSYRILFPAIGIVSIPLLLTNFRDYPLYSCVILYSGLSFAASSVYGLISSNTSTSMSMLEIAGANIEFLTVFTSTPLFLTLLFFKTSPKVVYSNINKIISVTAFVTLITYLASHNESLLNILHTNFPSIIASNEGKVKLAGSAIFYFIAIVIARQNKQLLRIVFTLIAASYLFLIQPTMKFYSACLFLSLLMCSLGLLKNKPSLFLIAAGTATYYLFGYSVLSDLPYQLWETSMLARHIATSYVLLEFSGLSFSEMLFGVGSLPRHLWEYSMPIAQYLPFLSSFWFTDIGSLGALYEYGIIQSFVGIALVLVMIFSIWRRCFKERSNAQEALVVLMLSFLLGSLTDQLFIGGVSGLALIALLSDYIAKNNEYISSHKYD